MKRLAVLALLAACGSKSAPPAPIDNTTTEAHGAGVLREGDYLCWGGFHEYLCVVTVVDGETRLQKVGGTDLYAGTVTAEGGGFRLRGNNQDGVALDLYFTEVENGRWRADLPPELASYSDHYTMRYMGAPGSVFGSQTYGGGYDEYWTP